MDSLLDELKHSSGEHNTYEVYMIHTNPRIGVYALNIHLGIPLMHGFITVYIDTLGLSLLCQHNLEHNGVTKALSIMPV